MINEIKNILEKNNLSVAANKKWLLKHHPIIYEYLKNKYNTFDDDSLSETYFRELNTIIEKPKCPICGNYVKFCINGVNLYRTFCSIKCLKTKEGQYIKLEKIKLTNLSKYGVENVYLADIVKEKIKLTNLTKYGVENVYLTDIVKEKIKLTNLTKYGVENPLQNMVIKNKTKESCFKKYGVDCYLISEIGKNQIKDIMINKYGSTNFLQSQKYKNNILEILEKRYKSLKENRSFNISKIENLFKNYLDSVYPNDYIYQYKSDKYPFNCDFYIISKDLYVEILANWTHGFHPFNKNNIYDLNRLQIMYEKSDIHPYYLNAINTWTVSDVKKREKLPRKII